MQTYDTYSIQSVIGALNHCAYIIDVHGNINYANDLGLKILRDYEKKVVGENINNIIQYYRFNIEGYSEILEKQDPINKAIKQGKDVKNILINYNEKNINKYLSLSVFPILEEHQVKGALVSLSDITEEHFKSIKINKEREQFISLSTELKTKCDIIEILRNREKEHLMHLKDVINNISEGLIVLDSMGKFSFCNRAIYSIIEVEPGDILNHSKISEKYEFESLSAGEDNFLCSLYSDLFKSTISVKSQVIRLIEKENGNIKYIEVNSNPIINKNNQLLYTIITLKDVTTIKEHELYAEEQARFIRDVVNTMDIPIAVLEYPNLKVTLCNENFGMLIDCINKKKGEEPKEGRNLLEIFYNEKDNDLLETIRFCGKIGKEYTCSPYPIEDSKGNNRFYKIKFKPYKDRYGIIDRIHLHASDITEEVNHNLELEKITKLKDEFFTVISHELRTPLTIIYSALQLANDIYKDEITPNIDKTLCRINQNCSRLLKLINNILDISKAEAGFLTLCPVTFDVVDITEFIVTSVNSYATSKGIDLIFDTNEEEFEVSMDKDKYEKILLNLLSNAVKFTPEGKRIFVKINIDKEKVMLKVKDEGVGIPEDKINYIFDRFAQVNSSLSRRAEGTGIGLSLVKKLVELMGGEIEVKSEVDKGSEFTISFDKIFIENLGENNSNIISESMNDKIIIEFSDVG